MNKLSKNHDFHQIIDQESTRSSAIERMIHERRLALVETGKNPVPGLLKAGVIRDITCITSKPIDDNSAELSVHCSTKSGPESIAIKNTMSITLAKQTIVHCLTQEKFSQALINEAEKWCGKSELTIKKRQEPGVVSANSGQ